MKSVNPATGELIREYTEHDPAAVEDRLRAAQEAFGTWRQQPLGRRADHLARLATRLREGRDCFARLMTDEMGKPIVQAEAEIDKCIWVCQFYAENGEMFLTSELIGTDAVKSEVRYDPLGPLLAIMPWNFPFWQVVRFAVPALMAGNVVLLKHAGNVCGSALAIEELFEQAEFPKGALSALLIPPDRVAEVIRHPAIRGVSLTGSDRAGAEVASAAGRSLKKAVLELGGSDPFIVLEDADLEQAARCAVEARVQNTGQSCIAAKRFIAVERVADSFEEAFAEKMRALRVGDPQDRETQIGPLAREDLLENLHGQVRRSVDAGATAVCGGERLNRPGFFYSPTVLSGVRPGMPAFDEETFGPVAALVRARDAEHAIELANHSQFGLGASLWTADLIGAEQWAPQIEAGSVFVNQAVRSDPRLPFGGVKRSGYGRELGRAGIHEFTNIKTVWIE